jgi:hypothetical protein
MWGPEDDFGGRFVLAMGLMRNRGPRTAWGGLLGLTTDHPEGLGLLRLEGRHRRWLGDQAGLDFGLGLAQQYVYSESGVPDVRARGVTLGVGFDYTYAGVDARVDLLSGGGRSEHAAFVGVHTSSYAAPVAASALAVVGVIAFIAFLAAW